MGAVRRIRRALFALGAVLLLGTLGYIALGFGPLDALYQTVTTTTTVGFREVRPLSAVGKVFTILLILVGVGTALYALVELLEALIEGHLRHHLERRRMNRKIGRLTGHVIICGWGRVGRASAQYLTQWVSMSPTPTEGTAFKVHSFEVNRWLLWSKSDSTWAWKLSPVAGEGTRLLTRIRALRDWRHPRAALLSVLLMEFGDFAMCRRMLRGIKARVESVAQGSDSPGPAPLP